MNNPDRLTVHWPTPDSDAPATAAIGDLEGYRTTVAATSSTQTTYLDTADWRLRGKGLVLTHEIDSAGARLALVDGERTVTTPLAADARWPALVDDLPAGAVRDGVSAAMWIRAVAPVLACTIRKDTLAVLNDDAKTVVRVDVVTATVAVSEHRSEERARSGANPQPAQEYDTATVAVSEHRSEERARSGANPQPAQEYDTATVAGAEPTTLLHVRPVLGYGSDAIAVGTALAAREGAAPAEGTLYDALLAAAGLPPAKRAATLSADTPANVAVAEALRGFAAEITGNTDGVIADVDTEFLHDLRVAVRRTRSMLKLVGDVLPFDTARYAADFKLLGDVTTPTRDLDVYLLEIPDLAASLTVGGPEDLDPFRTHIEHSRETALRELRLALRSKRFAGLMTDWDAALGAVTPAGPTVNEIARERIRRIYKKVVKIASALTPESEAEDVHTLRKRCKELRYLLEFFAPVCDPDSHKAAIKDLKQLQDILGNFQDGEVQSHGLRAIAEELLANEAPPAATLLAMGELAARFVKLQSDARAELDGQLERYLGNKADARIEALLP